MQEMARLAGFFGAHAIWSVAEGETLVPMVGSETADGKRSLVRLATTRLEDAVAQGRDWLAKNPEHAARIALAFDGFITLPDGKTDAIFIEARDYGSTPSAFTIAVPYRNAAAPGGFAVYRPKLLEVPDPAATQQLVEAFWSGVDAHEQASKVWNAHIDQSR